MPYQDLGTDGCFHLYEIYQDPDAFKDHLATAHVREFFDALARHSATTAQDLVSSPNSTCPDGRRRT